MTIDTQRQAWHMLAAPELFQAVGGTPAGSTTAEAQARRESYEPNRLPEQPPPAWWEIDLGMVGRLGALTGLTGME